MIRALIPILSLALGYAAPPGEGFKKARPGYRFEFPRDHGAHPDYAIEWWYITGHLFEADGRRYAFQATFFRRGVAPEDRQGFPASKSFGASHIYLAHTAVLDLQAGRYLNQERFNRDGWDAYAALDGLDLRNGNWTLRMTDAHTEAMALRGTVQGQYAFELTLDPTQPRVIFGKDGVSAKGGDSASYYITFPRLAARGVLHRPDGSAEVTGEAWMDHEISSSQLTETQVGWDWTSIQLDNGENIMMFLLREQDGGLSPYSQLTLIDRAGGQHELRRDDFTWRATRRWTSARTGIAYPLDFWLEFEHPVSGESMRLRLLPVFDAQEFVSSASGVHYWEGACDVANDNDEPIGRAFVEMTGYGESMAGTL